MVGLQPLWPNNSCRRQRLDHFLVAGPLRYHAVLGECSYEPQQCPTRIQALCLMREDQS